MAVAREVRIVRQQRGGQLPAQGCDRTQQLGVVGYLNHYRARAEHFFLKQLVLLQQQADIGLEQVRLGLITLLRQATQPLHPRVGSQGLQAFAVAVQGAGVEHGLWRLVSHVPGQLLDESIERR
ncbi:hypothetical protein D3C81_1760440 [compost metagenome]